MYKKINMKQKFLLTLILIIFLECLILCDANRCCLASIMFFILMWLGKMAYLSYSQGSTIDEYTATYSSKYNYNYYDNYDSSGHHISDYKPKPYVYKPYIPKEDELKATLFRKMKPNLNVVFETDEKTSEVNAKKQKQIEENKKPIVKKEETTSPITKPTLLLPPSSTSNKSQENNSTNGFNELVYITNSSEVTEERKKLYESIISFLKQKATSIAITKCILNNFVYIDIVKETNSIVFYMKELNLMKRYCISDDEMIETLNKDYFKEWNFSIVKFLPTSALDFYTTNYC